MRRRGCAGATASTRCSTTTSSATCTRRQPWRTSRCERRAGARDRAERTHAECTASMQIAQLVEAGLGVAVLPRLPWWPMRFAQVFRRAAADGSRADWARRSYLPGGARQSRRCCTAVAAAALLSTPRARRQAADCRRRRQAHVPLATSLSSPARHNAQFGSTLTAAHHAETATSCPHAVRQAPWTSTSSTPRKTAPPSSTSTATWCTR